MSGKRKIHQFEESALSEALVRVREGICSIREASRCYGVPRRTIQVRLHGRVPEKPCKMGPHMILNVNEEKILVKWCQKLATCGFSRKPDNLWNTVQSVLKDDGRCTPFKNNRLGLHTLPYTLPRSALIMGKKTWHLGTLGTSAKEQPRPWYFTLATKE